MPLALLDITDSSIYSFIDYFLRVALSLLLGYLPGSSYFHYYCFFLSIDYLTYEHYLLVFPTSAPHLGTNRTEHHRRIPENHLLVQCTLLRCTGTVRVYHV